jgi:EAL domain-containing protein (putative c-di-GMP-specific phosphodiesterase class I)
MTRGHAFAAYVALRREGLLGGRLAVNLSAAELLKPSVVDDLERQCEAFALDLGALTIEIREDVLLERIAPQTVGRLATLRGKGAWLALDDFGTGTSGLAQLLRLPLDELKLDRRFIANLGLDGRAERIVEGTVRLASSMGMRVVAEGIEEEAQARLARDIGCDLGQGWFFAHPMPAAALREWLATRRANASVIVPFHRAANASAAAK